MKVVQLNISCGAGSTGKICVAVSDLLTRAGVENYILYTTGNSTHPSGKKYMSALELKMQVLRAKVFGNYGFQSERATKRLLLQLDQIQPDIVHLHNIHGHNVHLGMLFSYLKEKQIKVLWTFHDCWAFTGYCPYYDMIECEQWRGGCRKCSQQYRYSWFFDRSYDLYERKKKLFTGLDMTIITPSRWLADQVGQSFLKDCPVLVIHNGIDCDVFKPSQSNFRGTHHISEDKVVLLGVAAMWVARKGLDVFIELSKRLDEKYQIVLVGTDEKVDRLLPDNIISIHRTNNQTELAEIYTAADLFVNPTREENFPTTHMEALACGTPVVTFNTGGCAEMLNEKCGVVVEKNNIDMLVNAIIEVSESRAFSKEACIARAKEFDQNVKFEEYVRLYE